MGEALLTFDEIVHLIRTPKPPLACRVVELTDGDAVRSARVIFDGIAGWLIETDEGTEFRHADDFVLFKSRADHASRGSADREHRGSAVTHRIHLDVSNRRRCTDPARPFI